MRRSQRDLPTAPDQTRDARLANLERGRPRQGGPKDPNPITQNAEPLRIIRGRFNTATPTILQGAGYSLARNGVGDVTITFTVGFSDVPEIQFTPEHSGTIIACQNNAVPTATTGRVFRYVTNTGAANDGIVHFTAMGPP